MRVCVYNGLVVTQLVLAKCHKQTKNIDRIRQEQMTSAFTVKYSDTLKGNTNV